MRQLCKALLVHFVLVFFFCVLFPGKSWPQSSLRHVRIGYAAADISFAPIWIAHDERIFRKYGLEVETLYVRGGPTLTQALIAGELKAAGVGGTPAVLASAAGTDVKIVLSFNNILPYEIFAASQKKELIRNIKDLKGKRVGVSRRGAESESVVRLLLKRAKVNPSDVTFLQIGGTGERLAALEKGSIDATAMSLPLNLKARKLGFPMIATVMGENIDWVHTALAMNQDFIDKSPQIAEAIVRAIIEATNYGTKNPEATKRIIGKYLNIGEDDVLQGAYQYFREFYVRDFRPSKEGIQSIVEEVSLNRPDIVGFKPEQAINLSVLERIRK